ncbi:hypothetical protein [Bacillus sp. T33-2]|uniref:hypothetical protein n=1 Tax=Bacillus sp. T33-2 TaxID=2054168 RepID=UPI0021559BDC|nr:hypothetical protein [Bacillus sp. T33-2]
MVAGVLPRTMKQQAAALEEAAGETLPMKYVELGKKAAPYNSVVHESAVILIILMFTKPF